jgi:hypothetical protein
VSELVRLFPVAERGMTRPYMYVLAALAAGLSKPRRKAVAMELQQVPPGEERVALRAAA